MSDLTPKQQRFVDEYLVDLNATQAAIRAGYSAATAEVQGPRLLGNVRVAEAIASAKEKRAERVGLTQDEVLHELAILGKSDVRHFRVGDNGELELAPDAPDEAWRAVSYVKHKTRELNGPKDAPLVLERTVELRLWDKPAALTLSGKHLGTFPDRKELTGKDGKDLIPLDAIRAILQEDSDG